MKTLTSRQVEVLEFIKTRSPAPTLQEISDNFGWCGTRAAQDHLNCLEDKGAISRTPFTARSIVVVEQSL